MTTTLSEEQKNAFQDLNKAMDLEKAGEWSRALDYYLKAFEVFHSIRTRASCQLAFYIVSLGAAKCYVHASDFKKAQHFYEMNLGAPTEVKAYSYFEIFEAFK